MDQIFAVLFVVYVAFAILSALIRQARTGPSVPPVVRPDVFPWPPWEGEEASREPSPPVVATGLPEKGSESKLERAGGEEKQALPVFRPAGEPSGTEVVQRQPEPVKLATEPGPGLSGSEGLFTRPEREMPVARADKPGVRGLVHRRVALTALSLREALILSELLGPPRAVRPYTPLPWRRERW